MTVSSPLEIQTVDLDDPRVEAMFSALLQEYQDRYSPHLGDQSADFTRHPETDYAPPYGELIILLKNEVVVAGGAFRRYDESTAEVKKMWTHVAHRRQGLARIVLFELEKRATLRGYSHMLLTTGPLQPEAQHLYLSSGYTPHFDTDQFLPPDTSLLFTKTLNNPTKA